MPSCCWQSPRGTGPSRGSVPAPARPASGGRSAAPAGRGHTGPFAGPRASWPSGRASRDPGPAAAPAGGHRGWACLVSPVSCHPGACKAGPFLPAVRYSRRCATPFGRPFRPRGPRHGGGGDQAGHTPGGPAMRSNVQGTVYLLHFLEPIGNPANPHAMAQHYIGWALVAADRISVQTAGGGAAIVRAVQAKGIGFLVAAF